MSKVIMAVNVPYKRGDLQLCVCWLDKFKENDGMHYNELKLAWYSPKESVHGKHKYYHGNNIMKDLPVEIIAKALEISNDMRNKVIELLKGE